MKTLLTTTMALGVIMALEASNPVKAAVNAKAAQAQQQGPVTQAGFILPYGARPYYHRVRPYRYHHMPYMFDRSGDIWRINL